MLPSLMHATQVARAFHTKGWVYEEKIDGWRMLAHKEAGHVRLVSRNGRDHTKRFRDAAGRIPPCRPGEATAYPLLSALEALTAP
jgi:ATP-dependent DNA ligase